MNKNHIASDFEEFHVNSMGQEWVVSWFPPNNTPEGKRHGSVGLCLTKNRELVLITNDGETWELPGGRPENVETWEQTLRREMREEACVEVLEAQLLGFVKSLCKQGHKEGLVLVRSFWQTTVKIGKWVPEFETLGRKFVSIENALQILEPDFSPIINRALSEAGLFKFPE